MVAANFGESKPIHVSCQCKSTDPLAPPNLHDHRTGPPSTLASRASTLYLTSRTVLAMLIRLQALYVNIGGASDFWFTAGPECVPNGPHFSYVYYITYASLVGSAAGMVGVALFQAFLSQGTFRRAFCTTLLLKLVASLFDLFIITRDNIRFGIPDKVAFMLGDASKSADARSAVGRAAP